MKYLAVTLIVCMTTLVFAQHEHPAAQTIDGAEHPELIPESVAQRLVLLNIGISDPTKATEQELQRQQAVIEQIRLSDNDAVSLLQIANQFVSEFHARVEKHNTEARAGNEPDISKLVRDRDILVASTMDHLKSALSKPAYAKFVEYIRNERTRMKTTEVGK